MGMYDSIEVDSSVELPKPEGFGDLDFHKRGYQTKDLHCCLERYKITAEGLLKYEAEREWVVDDSRPIIKGYYRVVPNTEKWVLQSVTDYVYFYDAWHDITPSQDAWIEYVAHVIEGRIKEIKIFKFELTDNSNRIKSAEEFKNILTAHKNRKWYQILFDSLRDNIRIKLLWINQKHINFAEWIQRQIFKI